MSIHTSNQQWNCLLTSISTVLKFWTQSLLFVAFSRMQNSSVSWLTELRAVAKRTREPPGLNRETFIKKSLKCGEITKTVSQFRRKEQTVVTDPTPKIELILIYEKTSAETRAIFRHLSHPVSEDHRFRQKALLQFS